MASRCHSRRLIALAFIRRYFADYGASPSQKEIAAELGVPVQRVGRILDELEAGGDILRTPGKSRGIRLPERWDELSSAELAAVFARRGVVVVLPVDEAEL